jgi:hypothetical protein
VIRVAANSNAARREFQSILARAKNPTAVLQGMGREAGNLLKKHFREKDRSEVNKLAPGRRQHLWLEISRGVSAPFNSGYNTVSISINHPAIAQKVFGGPIVAKRVRNLAIPQSEDAYARTPATFEHETGRKLVLLKGKSNLLLASRTGSADRLQMEFVLTPRVHQDPDPTALPDRDKFIAALVLRGQKMVDRQSAGNAGNPT